MALGLQTNSATDLGFLVHHFLVSRTVQQFQMKLSMNTRELSLWQATDEHLQKLNLVCSPHVSTEWIFIIEVEGNLINLPSLWSDDMDIDTLDVFQNRHLGGPDQKSVQYDQLRHWQNTDVKEACWSTSFNLLPNYL